MSVNRETRTGRGRPGRTALWAVAALALIGVVAVGAAVIPQVRGRPWLAEALTSRVSITCGLALLLATVALSVLLCVLWRLGQVARARSAAPAGQDGAAMLEFALALPIALMLVLIMIQSSLLMGGNLCVHYSAWCAARSAIVTIPLDTGGAEGPNVMDTYDASGKHLRIRLAALWALLPISGGGLDLPEADECRGHVSDDGRPLCDGRRLVEHLREFFLRYNPDLPRWLDDPKDPDDPHRPPLLAVKAHYADAHTEVVVAEPRLPDGYGESEDIRVSVRHEFYLSVPYAARVFSVLASDGLALGQGHYATTIHASTRLTNEGVHDYIEEEILSPPP